MAKKRGPKRETIIIKGEAVWPKLDVPDTYQPMKDGKPSGPAKTQYKTNLKVDDAELKRLKAKFVAAAKAEMEREGNDVDEDWRPKLPFQKDKETKEITIVASSKHKPAMFDARNGKLPEDLAVGGGSKIAINVTLNPYTGFGRGLNLYLNQVQVLKLDEKSFGKSAFEETEGYAYEGGGSSSKDDDDDEDDNSSKEDLDDEIPF